MKQSTKTRDHASYFSIWKADHEIRRVWLANTSRLLEMIEKSRQSEESSNSEDPGRPGA